MASNSREYTPQQYRKYNGQSVFKALSALGTEASADELANFISDDIGEQEEIILPEIKQVLRRGITNGFLVRNGEYYSFVPESLNMHVDSAPNRRSLSSRRKNESRKRSASSSKMYEKDSESEEEGSEEPESEDEEEDEMQVDNWTAYRPRVRLYETYHPPTAEDDDDEQYDEQEYEPSEHDEPLPPKRIRLQPIIKRKIKRNRT